MPCTPISESNLVLPSLSDGFGGLAVPSLPAFDIPFKNLPLEDLLSLFNNLGMILPFGTLKPNLSSNFSKDVMDSILSLLEKFTPILMLYTFFMPILNMILCIIEVLCAISNPFKLVKAIIRLFRVCIPEFLALFPIFALILMIISLLLLILAIILYIIQRLIDFILQIIANIRMLVQATASFDNDSVIAITIKLADLLCIFQNLFVLLGVIVLIFQVIERLLNLSFRLPPCDDNDGSDDGCCTPDVCPSFIKNNKQIISSTGVLQYFNKVIQTPPLLGQVVLRNTSYQLYDPNAAAALAFNNITRAFDLPAGFSKVFFPEGQTYSSTAPPDQVPYTADIRFFYDPLVFGRTDTKGARFIRINKCIVTAPPVDGVSDYQNVLVAPFNGTVFLAGGTAFEDDGVTIMRVNANDASAGKLETVIFIPDLIGSNPQLLSTDGIKFNNITYTFKINHTVLVSKTLITLGCHPDVAFNKNFINTAISTRLNTNFDKFKNINLPNVASAQECVANAISKFRESVSVGAAEELQTTVTNCLNKLKDDTTKTLEDVITVGFDPFKSTFTVDPSIQFTTKPIKVSVSLNEGSGGSMISNLPENAAKTLASKLFADISLGEIDDFIYDSNSSKLTALITSKQSGNGNIKVAFDNQFISILDNPTDTTQTPSIKIKELLYTFVQSGVSVGDATHRDERDVSNLDTNRDNGN